MKNQNQNAWANSPTISEYILIKPSTANLVDDRVFGVYEEAVKACPAGAVVSCCSYIKRVFGINHGRQDDD